MDISVGCPIPLFPQQSTNFPFKAQTPVRTLYFTLLVGLDVDCRTAHLSFSVSWQQNLSGCNIAKCNTSDC